MRTTEVVMTIEGAALLEIRNLDVLFGEVHALDQVNLTIWPGQIVSVVGPNGAGKTTLMKAVAGLIHAVQGEVAFRGEPIQGLPPYEVVRRGLVYIPEGMKVFPLMSVLENLEVGAYTARDRKAEQLSFVFTLFPLLAEKRYSPAGTLSGGQKRMLTIARGLMSGARLLLLDDPFLGLAPKDVSRLCRTLKELRGHGITLVLAGQHVRRILRVAGRAYLIEEGRITLSGTGDQLLDHPHLQESLFGMMAKAGSLG
jgi:branched-chain amino acid transport system ATP-binding protein